MKNKTIEAFVNRKTKEWGCEKIYHYTKANGFEGIISSKKMWLCAVSNMEDTDEVRGFINQMIRDAGFADNSRIDTFSRLNKLIEREIEYYEPYAACFTISKEDATAWDRYADRAQGICLEFDVRKLLEFLWTQPSFILNKVFYDVGIDINSTHPFVEILKEYICSYGTKFGVYDSEDELIHMLVLTALVHKNYSFRKEEEIRLFPMGYHEENFEGDGDKGKHYCLNFMENGTNHLNSIITNVTLGTRCKYDMDEARAFLKENGCGDLCMRITTSNYPVTTTLGIKK